VSIVRLKNRRHSPKQKDTDPLTQSRGAVKKLIGTPNVRYFYRSDRISDEWFFYNLSEVAGIPGKLYPKCSCTDRFRLRSIWTGMLLFVSEINAAGTRAVKLFSQQK